MIRSEYRRAFIMLRAAMQGYGGHVRLERRTLTGSLYFIVTAPQDAGALRAALAGERDGQYYAAPLGELSRDRRGQLTLAWQFDPRAIDGRALEAYAWVVVADAGADCGLALIGNVEGSRPLDSAALERAVCALYAEADAPAADLPAAEDAEDAATRPRAAAGDIDADDEAARGDIRIYTGSRSRLGARRAGTVDADTAAAPQRETASNGAGAPADAPRTDGSAAAREAAPSKTAAALDAATERREAAPLDEASSPGDTAATENSARAPAQTAAQALGLDITRTWPDALEPLRRLFATQAPLPDAPDGEYVYIRAPMPAASGFDACLVGLRAVDGRATHLRYALPARYSPQPPAGMEGYRWLDGGGEGYWVMDMDAKELGIRD